MNTSAQFYPTLLMSTLSKPRCNRTFQYFYRRPTNFREGNVFSHVCRSVILFCLFTGGPHVVGPNFSFLFAILLVERKWVFVKVCLHSKESQNDIPFGWVHR